MIIRYTLCPVRTPVPALGAIMVPANNALRLDYLPERIARLTFDQPGSKANTLGQAALTEFEAVLSQLEANRAWLGLILHRRKPATSIAGADWNELGSARP